MQPYSFLEDICHMPALSIGTYWDSSLLSDSVVVLFCVIALSNRNQLMWTQPSQRLVFVDGAAIFGISPSNWPSTLSLSLTPTKGHRDESQDPSTVVDSALYLSSH